MKSMTVCHALWVLAVLAATGMTACTQAGREPGATPRIRPGDAFHQFDPPGPGVANRPGLGLGGTY